MANGFTIFSTYILVPASGYTEAVHCNYIQSFVIDTTNPNNEELRLNFIDIDDFKFLSTNVGGGTGYTANQIYIILQLIDNSPYANLSDVKPLPDQWRIVNVTNQVTGYTTGSTFILTPANLMSVVFKVPLMNYNTYQFYNLTYLNYPILPGQLSFGDEIYFLGNVSTDIHADVFPTNLSIPLPLGQYNSSTNATWSPDILSVSITEVGLYDGNNNLVAIGKFNDPVLKNANISRTIQFAIDF
jgi:hypothetical protein